MTTLNDVEDVVDAFADEVSANIEAELETTANVTSVDPTPSYEDRAAIEVELPEIEDALEGSLGDLPVEADVDATVYVLSEDEEQ